jgi:aldehyde dehydrogenase (NAD+)
MSARKQAIFEGVYAMTYDNRQFFIDGAWVDPIEPKEFKVINPATEAVAGVISMGSAKDVDLAVTAARRAFDSYSHTPPAGRLALMERILVSYKAHYDEIAQAISIEMGAPVTLSKGAQTAIGVGHISAMIDVLKTFQFEEMRGTVRLIQEPVGVCALITPWNWPMNQVAAKVIPALAAGCTMVLKPSEYSPFSAIIWARVMQEAGVPKGVFNLINGEGATVGAALSSHKEIDMVSFTGSTRAGTEVAKSAAASVKRVHQELGGKSPNVLLDDADFEKAVKRSVMHVFQNSGQSCNAPTRMLVPKSKLAEVEAIAKRVAESVIVGDPMSEKTNIGPVVSKVQFDRVEGYIAKGIAEGAKVVTGGSGRPEGLEKGYYVKPTIFSNVNNQMTIAREEIFGPVLCILPYDTEEEAVQIANDTPYGLAAYVWSQDNLHARRIGSRIRAGQVTLNGASGTMNTPFGGFKASGNGREYGEFGLRDFLEVKAVIGVDAA